MTAVATRSQRRCRQGVEVISRRAFIVTIAGSAVSRPLTTRAQQVRKHYKLGILGNVPLSDSEGARLWGELVQGLRDLGYVEGQNLIVEHRSSEGRYAQLPALAAELVRLKPDVIVVPNASNALAARDATQTIPIVAVNFDPLATGLGASFARPGGNVTGLSLLAPEIVGKQLELLKEIVPRVDRVAMLSNPINRAGPLFLDQAKGAARTLGLQLQSVRARRPEDIESAFTSMRREQAGALLVLADSMFILQRRRIADLAAKSRLPAMYTLREHMQAGGLAFYGPSMVDNFRRAAVYVDKILKGAKPGDLPVEQPTKFELVINLKTAKTLGLTIPSSLLVRADQIIE
jgi:putative ABC transport system substrate-binding protein